MMKKIYNFSKEVLTSKIFVSLVFMLSYGIIHAVTYYSAPTATDFNATASWSTNTNGIGGSSPASITNADDYVIQNGATLSLTASVGVRSLKIGGTSSGTLNVAANTLTVEIASQNNTEFLVWSGGQLNVTGGTILVNGAMYFADGSGLNQTSGLIKVDGNSGTAATSVGGASGTNPIFCIGHSTGTTTSSISTTANAAKFTLTGGTIQIVDPTAGTSTSAYSFAYRAASGVHVACGTGHTVKFGDGLSTQGGGSSTTGFYVYMWVSSGYFSAGNIDCDILTGTNRFIYGYQFTALANLNIISGEFRSQSTYTNYIGGNITNNGTLTTLGTLVLANYTNATQTASTNAQTISGTGIFRNLTASPTANFASLTINNSSAGGVTFSSAQSLLSGTNTGTVSGTLTFTNGVVNTGSNTFILGVATGTLGTLTYTAGGFGSGSSFARWFAAAGTSAATITAGSNPSGTTTGFWPFISGNPISGMQSRHFYRTTGTFSTGGPLKVTMNDGSGSTSLSPTITSTYTYDLQSNVNWVVATVSPAVLSGTCSYGVIAPGSINSITGHTLLINGTSLAGTTATGTTLPTAQSTSVSTTQQVGTFRIATVASETPVQSVTSGKWEDGSTWSSGTTPVCGTNYFIMNGHSVTIDGTTGTANCANLTINSGGILNASAGTLNVGCTNFNNTLSNSGTLNATGATINVNGNLLFNNGGNFTHSAGTITIDGNNGGSTTNSVASGTHLVAFGTSTTALSSGTYSLTGGTIIIKDPHTVATATSGYSLYGFLASGYNINAGVGHTIQFGDGTSTDAGGHTNGFNWDGYVSTGRLNLGNVIVNAGTGTNRNVVQQANTNTINGNFTITSGTYSQNALTTNIAGNIAVNGGTLFATGTINLARVWGTTNFMDSVSGTISTSGAGVIQNLATSPTANFTNITINNFFSMGGVTFANGTSNIATQPANSISISGTLTFTAGKATAPSGVSVVLGVGGATPAVGTLSVTAGGFTSGSTFGRWVSSASTGTAFTAGTDPSSATSQYPFINSSQLTRHAWIERVTPTAGGIFAVTYNESSGTTTGLSLTDPSFGYIVNTRSNDNWVGSNLGFAPAQTSLKLGIVASSSLGGALSADSTRILQAAGFVGTHQRGTITPGGQRVGLTNSDFISGAFYLGANNNEIPNTSIASGDWNTPATWSKNAVPTCSDNVFINTGHTVTIISGTNNSNKVTINSGATLSQSAGTLVVGCTSNNSEFLINSGTFNMSGGTLTVNGKFNNNSTAGSLIQSGGDIIVDGNSGTLATSINGHIVDMYALDGTKMNLTGGTFTVVDPTLSATTGNGAFKVYPTNAFTTGAGWTLKLGDGVSTTAGGNTDGFLINLTNVNSMVIGGDVIVNTQGATWAANRHVTTANAIGMKNLTITKGDYRLTSINYINGNITNNDTLTHHSTSSNLTLATYSGSAATVSSNAQTIGGTGVFRNSTTNASITARLIGMTVNNNNATGITLNVPLSISGTLTMTSGLINTTSTNLLTLGTASAAATLSGTPSATNMIVGPFARTFAASRTSAGTYSTTTLFPVGKGGAYLPLWVDPTTTSGGAVIMTGEAFTANTGSAGSGVSGLSANSWSAIPTTGGGNLTASRIQLSDASVLTTSKLLQATTSTGAYTGVTGGSTSSGAGGNVTSITDIAPYNGYFAYGDLATCTAPSNQPTNFVTSLKTSTSFTVTFDSASTSATGYLVVRDTTGNTVAPSNGTLYAAGVNTSLTGTVIGNYYTFPFTFSQTGLTAGTNYEYFIYAFNNSGCSGPTYNLSSPLTASVTTCAASIAAPTAITASNITTTDMVINFTASTAAGVTDHEIDVSTNSGFTTYVSGYQAQPTGVAGSSGAQTYSISGLNPATTYYIRLRATDGGGCYSANTTTLTQATACNPVTSFSEDFETTTGSNFNACWSKVGATGSSYPQASTGIVGSRNLYIYNGAVVSMPPVSNASASTHRFKMKVRANFTSGEVINFGYLTNPNDATTFVTLSSITPNSTTIPQDFELSPVTCPAGITTLAIRNGSTLLNSNLIDNIVYEPIPSPTINSVTSSTACSGSTKVVITGSDMNNITTATIGGVSLLPFDSVSSTRLVKNAMTTAFSGTTSITNNIGTGTNGTTLTFTNAPALTLSGSTQTNCSGQTNSGLTTVTSTLSDYNSYIWTPTTGVTGDSATGWTFNPSSTTTYTLNTSNASGCANSKTMVVTVNTTPSALTLTQGKLAPNCFGTVDSLMASGGTITSSGNAAIGNSTLLTSATTQPTAFCNRWSSYWHQMVFTPTELIAQGLTAGSQINSLSFNITTLGDGSNVTNATIRMGNAAAGTISSFQTSGLTQVFSASTYTHQIGVNTFSFTTPYTWDGISNLMVELFHNGVDLTNNSQTYYTTTTGNTTVTAATSTVYANVAAYAAAAPTASTSTQRLNTVFGWTKTASNKSWSPTTGLYTNRAATIAYVGGDSAKVYTKPASTTKYYVTAANGICTRVDSIVDSIKSASTNVSLATSTLSGATSQCADASGWTYYENPSNSNQLIFGINKGSSGMAGETISISVNGSPYTLTASSNGTNQEHQSFLMGRGWDVTVTTQPSSPVQVRFFYDPADTTAVNTARDAAYTALTGANSSTLAVKSPFEWFKTVGVPYDASWRSSIVGNKFPSSHVKLSPTYGVLNGVNYVEFTVSSFSGGSGGSGFGAPGSGGGVGLPVTWAGFDVKSKETGNDLVWKTASEHNTDYFQVEYSYDGIAFTTLANKIKAAGNSADLRTYNYLHSDFSTYVYYRIKQVDIDGRTDYSEKKVVKRTSQPTFSVNVYPIPMNEDNIVKVEVKSIDKSPLSIQLTDITGKVIRSKSFTPQLDVVEESYDMSPLTNGIYFIEVKNGQGKETIKISK